MYVGVNVEWRGIRVEAMAKEKQVIDFNPTEQTRETLLDVDQDAVDAGIQTFRETLDERAFTHENDTTVSAKPDGGSVEVDEDA